MMILDNFHTHGKHQSLSRYSYQEKICIKSFGAEEPASERISIRNYHADNFLSFLSDYFKSLRSYHFVGIDYNLII